MLEPNIIFQTAELEHIENPTRWYRAMADKAIREGCTFFRQSHTPDYKILLLECWQVTANEQGEPRFQLTATLPEPPTN